MTRSVISIWPSRMNEALARAHAAAGDHDQAKRYLEMAREAGKRIADAHEREHFFDDLRTVPGYEEL